MGDIDGLAELTFDGQIKLRGVLSVYLFLNKSVSSNND